MIRHTHMPFVTNYGSRPVMLFCGSEGQGDWRPYWTPYEKWEPQPIQFNAFGGVECSPAMYPDGDEWVFSEVAGWRLVEARGVLGSPLHSLVVHGKAVAGCVTPDYIVTTQGNDLYILPKGQTYVPSLNLISYGFTNDIVIRRITFMSDDPDKLIITGLGRGVSRTIVYSISQTKAWLVVVGDASVYKSYIWQDTLIYALKYGADLETRRLVMTQAHSLVPL